MSSEPEGGAYRDPAAGSRKLTINVRWPQMIVTRVFLLELE